MDLAFCRQAEHHFSVSASWRQPVGRCLTAQHVQKKVGEVLEPILFHPALSCFIVFIWPFIILVSSTIMVARPSMNQDMDVQPLVESDNKNWEEWPQIPIVQCGFEIRLTQHLEFLAVIECNQEWPTTFKMQHSVCHLLHQQTTSSENKDILFQMEPWRLWSRTQTKLIQRSGRHHGVPGWEWLQLQQLGQIRLGMAPTYRWRG